MSLTTGEMSAADLAAVVGNSGNNGMDGFGGGSGWWIILLFLVLFGNGGWGNNGGVTGGGNGGAGGLYPWMNQAEITQDGFRDQMLNSNITGIRDGIGNLSTQLCNCCADMRDTVSNGFYSAEIAANNRQMANMQTAFAAQTAMSQGFSGLSSQFADCCCENRLANCQTQNIIQNEASATRFADLNNTRDIIQSQSNGTQAILDKLCQLELNGKNDRIADLERQLTMANLAASQTAQTSRILADNAAQTVALEQYLNPTPIPAYMVQNPNCCQQTACGCGCGGF